MTQTPTFTPAPTQTVIPWSTPTPYAVSSDGPDLGIDFALENMPSDWAESVVQGFNLINTNGFLDGILWIIIILFALLAFRRLINNIRQI